MKEVAGSTTTLLVDFGPDWATRPPFPPLAEAVVVKAPEPPKEDPAARTKQMLTDAAALLKEAMPVYQEIGEATDPIPSERAARAKWKSRAEDVRAKLSQARRLYAACRDTDPVVLDRRVGTLDGLLEALDGLLKRLE